MYQLNVSFTPYLFKQIVFIMKGNYVIVMWRSKAYINISQHMLI